VIYFAKAEDTDLVKIGYTFSQPEKRLKGLQTGCPHELLLLYAIEGDQDGERELHRTFAHLRENGEWFRYEGELRSFLWLLRRFDGPLAALTQSHDRLRDQLREHEGELFPDRHEEDVDDPNLSAIAALKECLDIDAHYQTRNQTELNKWLEWLRDSVLSLQRRVTCLDCFEDASRSMGGDCRA
jgi:hypothetical protein